MVQVRWGHINREFSPLTQAQSILLDGHFVMEHSARNRAQRFFNFNGTAGIWRRDTIVDAGGWQHDTLTEDLDLSYRAQLKGWRFVYLQDVISSGEVPVDINAFKSQQNRWAKGSAQTALKLLPRIMRSQQPLPVKIEAFFHLTANFAYPLLVVLSLLMPLAILIRSEHRLYEVLLLDLPCFFAATISVCAFYAVSQREMGEATWDRFKYIPFVMSIGIGLSMSNAKAVMEAFFGHQTPFLRTPKHGVIKPGENWASKRYRGAKSVLPYLELAMAAYYSFTLYAAVRAEHWLSIPFLFLFQLGFAYVGLMSLVQSRRFGAESPEASG
jgi:cellulose synthase/poly-beta-1,6-N-acetylglucosamine synthase-like glycosyltransferase